MKTQDYFRFLFAFYRVVKIGRKVKDKIENLKKNFVEVNKRLNLLKLKHGWFFKSLICKMHFAPGYTNLIFKHGLNCRGGPPVAALFKGDPIALQTQGLSGQGDTGIQGKADVAKTLNTLQSIENSW
jgi:hypothetical protein